MWDQGCGEVFLASNIRQLPQLPRPRMTLLSKMSSPQAKFSNTSKSHTSGTLCMEIVINLQLLVLWGCMLWTLFLCGLHGLLPPLSTLVAPSRVLLCQSPGLGTQLQIWFRHDGTHCPGFISEYAAAQEAAFLRFRFRDTRGPHQRLSRTWSSPMALAIQYNFKDVCPQVSLKAGKRWGPVWHKLKMAANNFLF